MNFPVEEYRAAVEAETSARNLSMLELTEDVCGVAVRPLTLRDVIALDGIASPFMVGGRMPTPEDVIVFLWMQSAEFKPSKLRLFLFARRHRHLDYLNAIEAIRQYVDDAFMDSPGGSGKPSESYYSFAAAIVDRFASEYGWAESQILDVPLKRLFQYLNAMRRRNDHKAILFNPKSGKVRRDFLMALNRN